MSEADVFGQLPVARTGSPGPGEVVGAFEMRPCPGAPWTRLDDAALTRYLASGAPGPADESGPDVAARTRQERLTVWRDGRIHPTVAGYVLFGVRPEAWQPAWRVIVLRLGGTERASPVLDRLETDGPAPVALEQAVAFLERHGLPGYPPAAVREALANAVAHRDYAAPSPVIVRLYEDRLEVQNPGGPPEGVTLAQLLAGSVCRPRNPVIAAALRRLGWMAGEGSGLARIGRELAGQGLPPPRFAVEAGYFRVTLPARHGAMA